MEKTPDYTAKEVVALAYVKANGEPYCRYITKDAFEQIEEMQKQNDEYGVSNSYYFSLDDGTLIKSDFVGSEFVDFGQACWAKGFIDQILNYIPDEIKWDILKMESGEIPAKVLGWTE